MAFFSSTAATGVTAATQKDAEVADPPTDSVSSLAFSNQADYLAVGSWDNSVRFVEHVCDSLSLTLTRVLGARLRDWAWREKPGKGDVPAPGASPQCVLEPGE